MTLIVLATVLVGRSLFLSSRVSCLVLSYRQSSSLLSNNHFLLNLLELQDEKIYCSCDYVVVL